VKWEPLSMLNLRRLGKIIEDEDIDNKIRDGILKFAEEMDGVSVKLLKKREEKEE
jgi:hypothetical protein